MRVEIKFENITKKYDDKAIIENFNLEIKKGEFVTIVGTSGSGKTTILKMINGLKKQNSGNIFINGENIKDKDIVLLRRNMGYAVQGSILFPHMSVEQNISYVPNLLNKNDKKKTKEAVSKWMNIVKLDDSLRDRYVHELSGGQKQRVAVARSLAASPEILLMDEPFGAVDEITRKELQRELKEIHEKTNITILFVTHDINEALTLATKVLVMDKGKIQQYSTPEEILSNPKTDFVKKLTKDYRKD